MLLDSLTPAWRSLHRRLREQCCVLVSHESLAIQYGLAEDLQRLEITFELVPPSERDARLRQRDFTLVITDESFRWPQGVPAADWFVIASQSGACDPCHLIGLGAADVTTDYRSQRQALVRRVGAYIYDRTGLRVLDIVVGDMSLEIQEDNKGGDIIALESRLSAYRKRLVSRPQIAVCDGRHAHGSELAAALSKHTKLRTIVMRPAELEHRIGEGDGPLVIVVPEDTPGSGELTERVARTTDECEILVMGHSRPAEDQGLMWSDWACEETDDIATVAARARTLWRRARRRLLYRHLLATLADRLGGRTRRTTSDAPYQSPVQAPVSDERTTQYHVSRPASR